MLDAEAVEHHERDPTLADSGIGESALENA
jgi:hypothetical protein